MLKNKFTVTEIILGAIALALMISIFLKAIFDLDTNYDAGWYHHLFAARIWGIISESSFISEDSIEYRYEGFPLLAHFFQGLLWKVTGKIQATNLVGYFSVVAYLFFLRSFFQVPLYLSTIAILTIPTVLTHAATSFVDLPGNIGVSVLMMMIFSIFARSGLPERRELIAAFLGAAIGVNTKPQLQPLVFVLYCVFSIRLIWLYFRYTKPDERKLWQRTALALLVSVLIFATPIKNTLLYANPFYPVKIELLGKVLNHKLSPQTYKESDRPQKWLRSVLEINTPKWTADQWNGGDNRYLDRAGGFFGVYVVFNLLMLLGLTIRENLLAHRLAEFKPRQATTALATIALVSFIPANFPQSHELRYFMFWMITLVSLNLSLIASWQDTAKEWLKFRYICLIYLLFMAIVAVRIDKYYLRPVFNSLDKRLEKIVKVELLGQMTPNEYTCMIVRHNVLNPKTVTYASSKDAIYYSSYFHPEIKYDYGIKAATEPKGCRNYPMIP